MIYQVECFSKVHKHTANRAMWIKTCHPSVNDGNESMSGQPWLTLRQPNWLLSRYGSMWERNYLPTIDSNTLAIIGRRDIGLRSLWMDVGTWRVDLRHRNYLRRFPNWWQVTLTQRGIKIAAKGWLNRGAKSRTSQLGSPSGPEDLCKLINIQNTLCLWDK